MDVSIVKYALRVAATNIRSEAASLELRWWGTRLYEGEVRTVDHAAEMSAPTCKTPACTAGHMAWAWRQVTGIEPDRATLITEVAREMLRAIGASHYGLGECASGDMFAGDITGWPIDRYEQALTVGIAEAAALWLEELAAR